MGADDAFWAKVRSLEPDDEDSDFLALVRAQHPRSPGAAVRAHAAAVRRDPARLKQLVTKHPAELTEQETEELQDAAFHYVLAATRHFL